MSLILKGDSVEIPKHWGVSQFILSEDMLKERLCLIKVENNCDYPREIIFQNHSVKNIIEFAPGIFFVEAKYPKKPKELLIISGGIHGNEKAGIVVADQILEKAIHENLEVREHFVVTYGNIKAFNVNGLIGSRIIPYEAKEGRFSNLNRCFGAIVKNPKTIAQERANVIMKALDDILKYSGAENTELYDIHQSFHSPRKVQVQETEGEIGRNFYTFMIAYVDKNREEVLNWTSDMKDFLSGIVFRDLEPKNSGSFAEFGTRVLKGFSGTLEMGEAGRIDGKTYMNQLLKFLVLKVMGEFESPENQENFDIWNIARDVIQEDFHFEDFEGNHISKNEIRDFIKVGYRIVSKLGYIIREIDPEKTRSLFANDSVLSGDRLVVLVKKG